MRLYRLAIPFALLAAPVAAQQTQPPAQAPASSVADMRLPPELSDPRLADRLTDALKVLSGAFLELPIGEAQAALEGRRPTAAERRRTVQSDSGLTREQLEQQIEASRPMMRASAQALISALPAMMRGMAEAQRELERATANMPRPDYPRR